jgi:hypothetical protein
VAFDTKIELTLDAADQARWDKRAEIALANKEITLADLAELEMIDDLTYRSFMLAQKAKDKFDRDMQINEANTKNNTEQAIAAAQAKGKADLDLAIAQHANKMEEIRTEGDNASKKASYDFAGNLKIKVADAMLANPGATVESLPDFIWESLGLIDASQKQMLIDSMQAAAIRKEAAMQQMQQAQEAQAQQEEQMQGGITAA